MTSGSQVELRSDVRPPFTTACPLTFDSITLTIPIPQHQCIERLLQLLLAADGQTNITMPLPAVVGVIAVALVFLLVGLVLLCLVLFCAVLICVGLMRLCRFH
jgi:hypothetical protein